MSTIRGTRLGFGLLAAVGCGLISSGWFGRLTPRFAEAAPAVPGNKIVDLDAQFKTDPVTYTKVTFQDQEIQPGMSTGGDEHEVHSGTPFQADENWLKNLSISLLNRTNKKIVRVELDIVFPDTGDGSPSHSVTVYRLWLGQRPEIVSFTRSGRKLPPEPDKQPLSFAPGQTLVLNLANYADGIQTCVEGGCSGIGIPFAQVNRIAIHRTQFYFADGMCWNLSGYGFPVLDHPGQFTYKPRGSYFPGGHPSQDWPPPTQPFEAGQHPVG